MDHTVRALALICAEPFRLAGESENEKPGAGPGSMALSVFVSETRRHPC